MTDAIVSRICIRCNVEKILSEFGRMARNPGKLNYTCKKCVYARQKVWNEKVIAERIGKTETGLIRCSDCGSDKTTKEFRRFINSKSGRVPYCNECGRKRDKSKYEKYKARYRAKSKRGAIKFKYGLKAEDFDFMMRLQDGKCGICKRIVSATSLSVGHPESACVDHDHKTGKIRGVLCRHCNGALGLFKDNVDNLITAVAYLRKGAL